MSASCTFRLYVLVGPSDDSITSRPYSLLIRSDELTCRQDFVYDGVNPPPLGYSEADTSASSRLTTYGASKLAFDNVLLASRGRVRGVILRLANVLGPQPPLFSTTQSPKFMEWLHEQLFCPRADATSSSAPPVRLWSDEIRSFVCVRDIAEIVVALLAQDGGDEAATAADPSPCFLLLNVGACCVG